MNEVIVVTAAAPVPPGEDATFIAAPTNGVVATPEPLSQISVNAPRTAGIQELSVQLALAVVVVVPIPIPHISTRELAVTGEIAVALPVVTAAEIVPDVVIIPAATSNGPPAVVPLGRNPPVASTPVKAIMDPLVTVELAVAKV